MKANDRWQWTGRRCVLNPLLTPCPDTAPSVLLSAPTSLSAEMDLRDTGFLLGQSQGGMVAGFALGGSVLALCFRGRIESVRREWVGGECEDGLGVRWLRWG
jgi:hypothetical protein